MIQPKLRLAAPTNKEAQRPKTQIPILGGEHLVSLLFLVFSRASKAFLVFFGETTKYHVFFGFSASWEADIPKTHTVFFGISMFWLLRT